MITASNAVARISLAATLLCGVVLSGCGKGDNQAAAPKGQVVARVGQRGDHNTRTGKRVSFG